MRHLGRASGLFLCSELLDAIPEGSFARQCLDLCGRLRGLTLLCLIFAQVHLGIGYCLARFFQFVFAKFLALTLSSFFTNVIN